MPTQIKKIFEGFNKEISGHVQWGGRVDCDKPGVYVVAISNSADKQIYLQNAPISEQIIQQWIDYVPKLLLDGMRPSARSLVERLKKFWLPDETIVFIGNAGRSLEAKIGKFYKTKLGEQAAYTSGHWIMTLSDISQLNIYWTITGAEEARDLEKSFIEMFIKNVSQKTKSELYDSANPLPFANLEYPKGNNKKHGIEFPVN